ncbi:hypothetical protein B0684_01380 [Thioalkalivibrio versutus]|nr:hypothetical protein B0684_01380 [Thioalkalivibrio versutus]
MVAQRPEVIAEAGSNHNGDPERARQLVDVAVESGASSVKFQFIFADGLYLPEFFDGERKVRNPVFDQRKKEELTETEWSSIWEYAHGKGIPVSASVFCERGVQLLYRLGSPYVKIASTDLTNHNLIGKACQCFQRVIVSTGMASLSEIDGMVAFVRESYPETDLQLMHCVSSYPCPLNEANTQRVSLLRHSFDLCVGYSDHTEGTESAVMALVQGATFFEKHFTVDRNQPGFDHAHAMESAELMNYVRTLADSMISLEKPANQSSSEELVSKIRARRGIYAAKDLPAGHILTKEDLLFVRPSSSFSGKDVSLLVGKALAQDVPQYAALGEGGQAMVVESNWRDASAYWKNEMDAKNM